MQDVESLVKTAVTELERMLSTKAVVGDPIVVEGATIIPLISVGFGFGAGGGTGKGKSNEAAEGGSGTGGGGGVKPVALVIVTKDGVRVETIKGSTASVLEKVIDTVGKVAEGRGKTAET